MTTILLIIVVFVAGACYTWLIVTGLRRESVHTLRCGADYVGHSWVRGHRMWACRHCALIAFRETS